MFKRFIKDHKIAAILLVLLVLFMVVGVPLIINWMARVPAVTSFFVTSWSANDALSYYGSVLGFLSTVILSGLALWQNHVIQEANDRHTLLLEQMEQIRNSPRLFVEPRSANGKASNLKISIKNVTDNIASEIIVSGLRIVDDNNVEKWKSNRSFQRACLDNHNEWLVELQNSPMDSTKERLEFDVRYRDPFYNECVVKVTGILGEGQSFPFFKITNEH